MKQITAYVREGMVNKLVAALETANSGDFTLMEARGIVGGLVTSTLLTLLVLPTVYAWLFKERATKPEDPSMPQEPHPAHK